MGLLLSLASLLTALVAICLAAEKDERRYSFGLDRFEELAGIYCPYLPLSVMFLAFTNCLYLLFAAFTRAVESVHHYYLPEDVPSYVFGLFFFFFTCMFRTPQASMIMFGIGIHILGLFLFSKNRSLPKETQHSTYSNGLKILFFI